MTQVGIYARISRDPEGTGLGVKRQLADCRQLASSRGWTIVDEYVDDDVSAYSGKHRPEYDRMLADIQARRIVGVVVWHTDRLTRQPRELEAFLDLTDSIGVTNLATVSGDLNLGTDDGRLMARLTGAIARKESDDKSRRLRRKHAELAQDGKLSGGGTRPYGYDDDRKTVRVNEARFIREAASRVLAGESLRSVCFDFTERGIPTVTGKQWTLPVMRRMLMSGRISGRREHKRQITAPGDWPGIIPIEQSDALRASLGAPHRRVSRSARRYVLAGMVTCTKCRTTMVSRPTADGRRRYICPKVPGGGCGGIAIVADELEVLVVEGVMLRLDTPQLQHALSGHGTEANTDAVADAIRADEIQRDELAATYADRQIGLNEWIVANRIIEARITDARRELAKRSGFAVVAQWIGDGSLLRDQWQDLPLSRQEAIIKAVIERIEIGPGRRGYNRFDHTRVTPIWRGAPEPARDPRSAA